MSSIVVSGDTSGSITLSAPAVSGSSVLTLPVATDTLVGKATTDTLTNKTLTGAAMNGTLGATTPSTGAFTTVSSTGNAAFGGGSVPVASGYQYGIGVGPNGLIGTRAAGNDYRLLIGTNSKLDGTYTSTTSQPVSLITMDNGITSFSIGPSGTAGNAITFTQAMTLDASGNLLVGTTGNSTFPSRGYFVGSASFGGLSVSAPGSGAQYPVYFVDSDATSASQQMVHFNRGSSNVGYITTTNTTTTYSTASDYRLKNTITPITGALAKVVLLKPCTYKWNKDGSVGEGFIAHELQEVCPIAVYGTKDGIDADGKPQYQGVDTSFLVATLTSALQELNAKFEAYVASHP